jgi:hypothetical protein
MSSKSKRFSVKSIRGLAPLGVTLMVLAMVGGPAMMAGAAAQDKLPEAPLVQQFEDVPDSHTFAEFINALYLDNIISGYACGGVGEPCGPGNLPYYRPNANVTRAQMSKFVDNGRRNIADAIGDSLTMTNTIRPALIVSTTATDAIRAASSSGAETIDSRCTRANQNCYAFYGVAATGDRPALFDGGRGTYVGSSDANENALTADASGTGTYGAYITNSDYRGAYVRSIAGFYHIYVPTSGDPGESGSRFDTDVSIGGDLVVSGSKTGYVVDVMQNAGTDALEAGDVVTIVGNSAAVLGEIPVVQVQKATGTYDSGVVGVVDRVLYVPSAETRAAYLGEQQARNDAMERRTQLEKAGGADGAKADLSSVTIPEVTISDYDGNIHADAKATRAESGRYVNVVTLGSYKAVKVDASFGAIKAGDLLTTSPNPGYAMKVTDKAEASGAIIGKALGDLASGTGTVPVMVTLK